VTSPVRLAGYQLEFPSAPLTMKPGETRGVTLLWGADSPEEGDLSVVLELSDSAGHHYESAPEPAAAGSNPTRAWPMGALAPDFHELPVTLATQPGNYELGVRLVNSKGANVARWEDIGDVEVVPQTDQAVIHPEVSLGQRWDDAVELLGCDGCN